MMSRYMPSEIVSHSDIIDEVSQATGFRIDTVATILDSAKEHTLNHLRYGSGVRFWNIGMLYAKEVKPHSVGFGGVMDKPVRVIRFRSHRQASSLMESS